MLLYIKKGKQKNQRIFEEKARLDPLLSSVSTGARRPLYKSKQRSSQRKFISIHAPSGVQVAHTAA